MSSPLLFHEFAEISIRDRLAEADQERLARLLPRRPRWESRRAHLALLLRSLADRIDDRPAAVDPSLLFGVR
jgi:hypothetical protein